MRLKSKTIFLLLFLLFIITVIIITVLSISSNRELINFNQNILENMKDGLKNVVIKQLYKQDIEDVYKLTTCRTIDIKYIDFDLNDDGFMDKIVTVRSPLHSSSEGDSLDFLINNKDGTYTRLSNLIIPLYAQSPEYSNARVCILAKVTNGYHNINIFGEDSTIVLVFKNGKYFINGE